MHSGSSAQINVCMWFRARDPEPQSQSISLVGLHTEPVLSCDKMHTEPFIYYFPFRVYYVVLCIIVSENSAATFSPNVTRE